MTGLRIAPDLELPLDAATELRPRLGPAATRGALAGAQSPQRRGLSVAQPGTGHKTLARQEKRGRMSVESAPTKWPPAASTTEGLPTYSIAPRGRHQ